MRTTGVQPPPVRTLRGLGDLPRLGSLLVLAAVLSGCAGESPPVVVAHEAALPSIDPFDAVDNVSSSVLTNVYESLVDLDRDNRLAPALATGWSTTSPTSWQIELRPDVRLHDGRTLTVEQVVASLERSRDPSQSPVAERLETIESIVPAGPFALEVRTRRPDPLLMHRLTFVMVAPLDAGADGVRAGSGPYRIDSWHDGLLDVSAFDDHWAGPAGVARARFVHVEPGEDQLARLRDRSVDVARWIPEDLASEVGVGELDDVVLRTGSSPRSLYLWMSSHGGGDGPTAAPLADPRVRRAIALAVDRERLVEALGGFADPLGQLLPRTVFGHAPDLDAYRYDPGEARALLAAAGYPDGLSLELTLVPGAVRLVEPLAPMLAEAGITLELRTSEWPPMLEAWRAGRLPFFFASWRFDSGEASLFLSECVRSRQGEESWNPGYSNGALDRLIDASVVTLKDSRRRDQFREIVEVAHLEVPLVPLVSRRDLYAVRRSIEWEPRFDGRVLLADMSR